MPTYLIVLLTFAWLAILVGGWLVTFKVTHTVVSGTGRFVGATGQFIGVNGHFNLVTGEDLGGYVGSISLGTPPRGNR